LGWYHEAVCLSGLGAKRWRTGIPGAGRAAKHYENVTSTARDLLGCQFTIRQVPSGWRQAVPSQRSRWPPIVTVCWSSRQKAPAAFR
jgi:hypothetical protein